MVQACQSDSWLLAEVQALLTIDAEFVEDEPVEFEGRDGRGDVHQVEGRLDGQVLEDAVGIPLIRGADRALDPA